MKQKKISLRNPQGGFHPEKFTEEEIRQKEPEFKPGLLKKLLGTSLLRNLELGNSTLVATDAEAGFSYGIKRYVVRKRDGTYSYYDEVYDPNR